MHILFLTDNFPPEVNAPASRTFEHAREWVRRGHEVTVLTCAPNFPKGKVFPGYRNRLWSSERIEGIRVIRVWTYIASNEGLTRRILDYQSYMISAIFASFFVKSVDVVIGTSPQFFTACAASVVSTVKRVPFVFELRDIWPESIKVVEAMRDSTIIRWLERLEMRLYRRADLIVSVTESFKKALVARGVREAKISVVTNGVDGSRFRPTEKDVYLETHLGLQGKFVAGYIGTHGMAHALHTLLDAASVLEDSEWGGGIHILLLGDGAEKQHLQQRADSLGLTNVTFLDTVPKSEVVRYWSLLDVSIIHLRRSELFKTVIPSKLFEAFSMGIPVLLGVEGESAGILERANAGLCFEPENVGDLSRKLQRMVGRGDEYAAFRQNGPKAALAYDRATLAERMLGLLEQCVRARSTA